MGEDVTDKLIASGGGEHKTTDITLPESGGFPSLDINQMNKDRKYGGIGKNVKQVTNFMTPEKWDALSPEERNRMNESWKSKNTKYFSTEADDPENIFGRMSLEERDKKLRELQAGAD